MSNLKQLIALIEQENMNEADYTVESWKTFKIALDNEKALLNDINATQEEVDLAYNELQLAKDGLINIDTNKTALKIAVDLANAVYNDASATQEQVTVAFDRLASAMQKLEFFKGDKTSSKVFIDDVTGLDSSKYTQATWAPFNEALTVANGVYEDKNAIQSEVNEAYTKLVTTFLNLILIPDKSLLKDLINQA